MEISRSNDVLRYPQDILPPVADWYAHRDVLITGASGFLGRVLIEKLLRSCPQIGTIFMLLRAKKGQQPQDRLHKITAVTLFDGLRRSNPDALKKLRVVSGDVAEKGLDLSAEDAMMLEKRISVVFHMAATVRFDEPFNKCILLNTRGTREVCELAKRMHKLQCFVYVSTAYSNCNRILVDETMYPPPGDWQHYVHLAENMDDYVMDVLSKKILGNFANTYVFSKSLAENVLLDYQHDLPIVLLRPSIVSTSSWDPIPGWTDNVYGPMGLVLVVLKGIMHVVATNNKLTADVIPVDLVVKALILSSMKKVALDHNKNCGINIYNTAMGDAAYMTFSYFQKISKRIKKEQTMALYSKPFSITIQNMRLTKFFMVLFDFVYASFLDTVLWLMGEKRIVLRILRMTLVSMVLTYYFGTNVFKFRNAHFKDLNKYINPKDKENFSFDLNDVCYNNMMRHVMYSYRKYFFKEKTYNHNITRFWFDVIAAVVAIIFVYFLCKIAVYTFAFGLLSVAKFAFMM